MLTLVETEKPESRIENGTGLKTRTSGSLENHPQFGWTKSSTSNILLIDGASVS